MNGSSDPVVMGLLADQPTALAAAMKEARRRDTSVRVVHAVWMPPAEAPRLKGEELRAAGQKVLDDARRYVRLASESPPVHFVLSPHPPIETLLNQSCDASLLVLGTDELGWFDRLMGGEVTTFVARHASCPVLVVPEEAQLAPRTGEIVVAIDRDNLADELLRCAFEQARLSTSKVQVLHATSRAPTPDDDQSSSPAIDLAVARWQTQYPDVSVVTDLVHGEAADACLRASRRAGLLIVGQPRPTSLGLVREKPVVIPILRHTSCPVLVVRPATWG